MSRAVGLAFGALVFLFAATVSLPAAAALRDYTRGQFTLTGSFGLRFEGIEKTSDSENNSEESLQTEFDVNSRGFIWDPRFMNFVVGLTLRNKTTSADDGESNEELVGFRFNSTLFPRWRYPYLPINLFANKSRSTVEGFTNKSTDIYTTTLGLNWGLFRAPLGRLRLSYRMDLDERVGDTSGQNETRHEFNAEAKRKFREAQWGESDLTYGYDFNSMEDDDSSYLQHNLFARDRSKLGEKMDLTANAVFYHRENEASGGGDVIMNDFLSTSATLQVRETNRFQHSYALGMSTSVRDGEKYSNYNGSAGLTYQYPFNEYWRGHARSGARASYSQSDAGKASNIMNATASGNLNYSRQHGVFRVTGGYGMGVSQSMGDTKGPVRYYESAHIGYSRSNNPFYADNANLNVRFQHAENLVQDYSLRYTVASRLTARDKLWGSVRYNMHLAEGNDSSTLSIRGTGNHDFSRVSAAGILTGFNLTQDDSGDQTRFYVEGHYRTVLYLLRSLFLDSSLRWEQRTEALGSEQAVFSFRANASYRLGRWSASLGYTYRDSDSDGSPLTEQRILVQIKRSYGLRY